MNRLERLAARRVDEFVARPTLQHEVYRRIHESESVKYAVGAMQPIDPEYTKNTFAEGERVRNQLQNNLVTGCEYEYQGSVTSDTHIKARSDIDLLVLIAKFYSLEPPQQAARPYAGNPIEDLLDLRSDAIRVLASAFPQATVDSSGAKSVTIEGGSLRRKVDVVPANWLDTNAYANTGNKVFRGVQILDAKKKERLKNTPFLHNARIAEKDRRTGGGLRKAIRLLKSLKYDSESISFSSYDLAALAYNMDDMHLPGTKGMELLVVAKCREFCRAVANDPTVRASLAVPDEHRRVFDPGHATTEGLQALVNELDRLSADILLENARSFRRLEEARLDY